MTRRTTRCDDGFAPGLCTVPTCQHWDGITLANDIAPAGRNVALLSGGGARVRKEVPRGDPRRRNTRHDSRPDIIDLTGTPLVFTLRRDRRKA